MATNWWFCVTVAVYIQYLIVVIVIVDSLVVVVVVVVVASSRNADLYLHGSQD